MAQYSLSDTMIDGIFVPSKLLNDEGYNIRVRKQIVLINEILDIVRDYDILNIGETLRIAIEPTFYPTEEFDEHGPSKYKMLQGAYFPKENLIKINPILNKKGLILSLSHELIHAEQKYEKRLDKWDRSGLDARVFTSFGKYVNLPWEAEAYRRQFVISEEIKDLL